MTLDVQPILFSGPMVRAILEGRKTQTRRVLPQPPENVTSAGVFSNSVDGVLDDWSWLSGDPRDADTWEFEGDFKVGFRAGDLLSVLESGNILIEHRYERDKDKEEPWINAGFLYAADMSVLPAPSYTPPVVEWPDDCSHLLCPAREMPRWASRITLEVAEVRVQRLQEISEEDAAAEGTREPYLGDGDPPFTEQAVIVSRVMQFRNIWNHLNAKPRPIYAPDANGKKGIIGYVSYPWEAGRRVETYRDRPHQIFGNPWVCAITFEAHQQNVDDFLKARAS